MHARHYSPALGRSLQPDPDRSETNLYAYTANNPITEIDPDGTCFILCAIINAVVDVTIYALTTENASLEGALGAAAVGAVTGFVGVGLLSKVAKVGAVARAVSKVSNAARTAQLTRWTRSAAKAVDNSIARNNPAALQQLGARAGDVRQALSTGRLAGAGRGNIIDQVVKERARSSWLFRGVDIARRGQRGVDFATRGIAHTTWDITTRGQARRHLRQYPGVTLVFTN